MTNSLPWHLPNRWADTWKRAPLHWLSSFFSSAYRPTSFPSLPSAISHDNIQRIANVLTLVFSFDTDSTSPASIDRCGIDLLHVQSAMRKTNGQTKHSIKNAVKYTCFYLFDLYYRYYKRNWPHTHISRLGTWRSCYTMTSWIMHISMAWRTSSIFIDVDLFTYLSVFLYLIWTKFIWIAIA